jgi:hypothetical protein
MTAADQHATDRRRVITEYNDGLVTSEALARALDDRRLRCLDW